MEIRFTVFAWRRAACRALTRVTVVPTVPAVVLLCAALAAPAWSQSVEVLNPDVRQETLADTICHKGYTRSVRPATSYTNGVKRKLMREQGLDWKYAKRYELDHIIPLTLGGHPRNIHNLQLQPWEGPEGARTKDKLEVRLAREVCHGKLRLRDAQACIWNDWQACLQAHRPHRAPRQGRFAETAR